MQVEVTTEGTFHKRLSFLIPASEVQKEVSRAFNQMAGKVRIPGFRQGKAPLSLLRAKYSEQVHTDVADHLMQMSTPQIEDGGGVLDDRTIVIIRVLD